MEEVFFFRISNFRNQNQNKKIEKREEKEKMVKKIISIIIFSCFINLMIISNDSRYVESKPVNIGHESNGRKPKSKNIHFKSYISSRIGKRSDFVLESAMKNDLILEDLEESINSELNNLRQSIENLNQINKNMSEALNNLE